MVCFERLLAWHSSKKPSIIAIFKVNHVSIFFAISQLSNNKRHIVSKFTKLCVELVRWVGVEPTRLAAHGPQQAGLILRFSTHSMRFLVALCRLNLQTMCIRFETKSRFLPKVGPRWEIFSWYFF